MVAAGRGSAGAGLLLWGRLLMGTAWTAAPTESKAPEGRRPRRRSSGALEGLGVLGDAAHAVQQVLHVLARGLLRLGQEPLQHALLEPLLVAGAAVELHGVEGVDRGA